MIRKASGHCEIMWKSKKEHSMKNVQKTNAETEIALNPKTIASQSN